MPGFGHGFFGHDSFGHWPWSRKVLFDALPGLYRQQDSENGGFLELWTESLRPSFDQALARILHWADLRDALVVRTQYNDTTTIRLGPVKDPDSPIEQRGVDGRIDASRTFISETARFRPEDLGKTLILAASGVPINNRAFKIAQLIGPTAVRCDPPLVLDAGPIRWLVKGFPSIPPGILALEIRGGDVSTIVPGWLLFDGGSEFTVTTRRQFFPLRGEARALTEAEGFTAQVLADGRLQVETDFSQSDVGKKVTIVSATIAANSGKFEVYTVDPTNLKRLTLHEPLRVAGVDVNGGLVYTLKPGMSGVTVSHIVDGISTPLSIVVRETDIIVNVATDGAGVATSTAAQIAAAVTADVFASVLVTAVVTGTGASVTLAASSTLIRGACLAEDLGPLVWARLPFPELRLAASAPPLGIVEQEGVDLSLGAGTLVVTALTAKFSSADVGKNLLVRGSALGRDGIYPIASVTSTTSLTVTAAAVFAAESGLYWEVRTPSLVGDETEVLVSAPSLIEHLARDFAIEVDQGDTEARQRSWVENVTQWLDLKGAVKAYEIIGAISGFTVTPVALFRVTKERANGIPDDHLFYLPDAIARSGGEGSLTSVAGRARLTTASAPFYQHDVGTLIRLSNCAIGTNNSLYEIIDFIDATTVELDPVDAYTAPDLGNAGTLSLPTIEWELRRIYTDHPPSRARFDDLNVELMQDIVGAANFLMDSYCWESDFIEEFPVEITAVTPSSTTGVPIFITTEVTGVAYGVSFSTARVVGNFGAWEITDVAGTTYALESMPVLTASGPPEVHTFTVYGGEVPALGVATLRYLCDASVVDCSYCRSAVVLARVVPAAITSEAGADVAKAGDRVVSRLETEIKPAHVRLICHVEAFETAPVIFAMVPGYGTAGTVVTIIGQGFTGATAVEFAGTSAAFTVDSDTRITATVPAGPPATSVDVTVEK